MNIIIISGYFYPQNTPRSFRTTELVKEFIRLGHEVTLFVPSTEFDYSDFRESFPITIRYYQKKTEKRNFIGVSIIDRVIFHYEHWLFDGASHRNMQNVINAAKDEKGYDLLITIAVPHYIHWAIGKLYADGVRLAERWVADCGDPFMLAGSVKQKPPFWFKGLEKRWCRYCDFIAVPTENSYQGYYPEFRDKIKVIPQGFNFEDVLLPQYEKNCIPTFAFAGSLIPGKRDPERLLEWLSTYEFPFRFVVFGNNVHAFFDKHKQTFGDKLEIRESIPRNELLPILAQMDFLINIGNGTKVQTPSKLIDYTLAKRPILTIESNDIKKDILLEFLSGNYSHGDEPINIAKYDIHNVTKQFLSLTKV